MALINMDSHSRRQDDQTNLNRDKIALAGNRRSQ